MSPSQLHNCKRLKDSQDFLIQAMNDLIYAISTLWVQC